MTQPQGYHVEHNGDCWQSVFPEDEAHLSQLHTSPEDAIEYMVKSGVQPSRIIVHDIS